MQFQPYHFTFPHAIQEAQLSQRVRATPFCYRLVLVAVVVGQSMYQIRIA